MFIVSLKTAALSLAAGGLTLAAPASAAPATHSSAVATGWAQSAPVYGDMSYEHGRHDRGEKRGHYKHRRYEDYSYRARNRSQPYYSGYSRNYGEPVYRNTRVWRGNDGRYYCRKSNGTTGLLVGAGVGALLGREVAGHGDRTLGAILGAVGGGLLGKTLDSGTRCG